MAGVILTEEERRRREQNFDFESLPVEIKHQVLKKLKTKFLQDVCGRVSRDWQGMVTDILGIRTTSAERTVSNFFQKEMTLRANEQVLNNPLETLKLYETTMLSKKFDATSVQVNADAVRTNTGLLAMLWRLRNCDCVEHAECLIRRLHIVSSFNLFVIDCDSANSGLRFYNLHYIERLDMKEEPEDIDAGKYDCPNLEEWVGSNHRTDAGISVFRDHIVVETAAKTILLLKITSVDHERNRVHLERICIIHLPLWVSALCLFEDRLIILYCTGHVGMWDKNANELFMSTSSCDLGQMSFRFMHRIKLYRMGSLAIIRTYYDPETLTHGWYVVDSNEPNLTIHRIDMSKVINAGFFHESHSHNIRTKDVLHLDIWYNCLIVQFQVERLLVRQGTSNPTRLGFKRVQRYPTVEDFLDPSKFRNDFLSLNSSQRLVSVKAYFEFSVTSPFVPPSLKPWQQEPPAGEPVPVADLIATRLILLNSTAVQPARNILKVFRIRLSNLPFNYKLTRIPDQS